MFTNLPDLIKEIIFYYHLSYDDLLNLRLTCKRIKLSIDNLNLKRVNLSIGSYPNNYFTFHKKELINFKNSFRLTDFNLLKSINFKTKFKNIKQLIIFYYTPLISHKYEIDLTDLNSYTNLIHLEIDNVGKIEGKLELLNLEIGQFNAGQLSFFELDCPKLSYLKIERLANAIITDNNSIYYLEVNVYSWRYDEIDTNLIYLIKKSKNLSTLCFYNGDTLCTILNELIESRFIFDQNFKLKQINLKKFRNFSDYFYFLIIFIKNLENANDSIANQIKFTINNYEFNSDELFKLQNQILNYFPPSFETRKLTSIELRLLISNSNFECLYDCCTQIRIGQNLKLSYELIDKFKNQQDIKIKNKSRLDNGIFEYMLKQWKYTKRLTLKSVNLTNEQLNLIAYYLEDLYYFKTNRLDQVNIDFLLKFRFLHEIVLEGFKIEKDIMIKLYDDLFHLKRIHFKFRTKHYRLIISKEPAFYNNCMELAFRTNKITHYQAVTEFAERNDAIDYCYNNIFPYIDHLI